MRRSNVAKAFDILNKRIIDNKGEVELLSSYRKVATLFLLFLTFLLLSGCVKKESSLYNFKKERLKAPQIKDRAEKFSFIVFGDNRPETPAAPQPRIFVKLARRIAAQKPDLVISVGDMIFGKVNSKQAYQKQFSDFYQVIKPFKNKFYPTPGNHDIYNHFSAKYYQEVTGFKPYYSFAFKNSQFIILSTEMPENKGRIGNRQFEWLKNELKRAKAKTHIFVFMHRPLLSVMNPQGIPWKHQAFVDQKNEAKVIRLLTAYQVDIVFAGHEHFFNQQKRAGVTYIITAPAGSAPYSDRKHGGFHHFVKVKVNGEKLNLKVFSLEKIYNPDQILKPVF